MRFAFTDDQLLFRDAVRELLQKECPPDVVRAAWEAADDAPLPSVWSSLAAMGVVGLTAPEPHGGLGLREIDLVLLLEESGRVALPAPLVETAAVAGPLFAALEDAVPDPVGGWLSSLATGDLVVAASLDGSGLVPHAARADVVLLHAGRQLVAVPAEAIAFTPQTSVDGSRHLASCSYDADDATVLTDDAGPHGLAGRSFDRGALGTAAQLLGVADHLLATTVDYVKQREQFGVPIGSFQAIKHHLADSLLALEFARPVVYRAAYSMATDDPDASVHVAMAKCYASEAALTVSRHALQCHGAIGYTVEYDLHLWLKRAWVLAGSWGDAAHHRSRVADTLLGGR